MDYTEVIFNLCDLFFILYNKLADKGCYQQNLMDYLFKLDEYINVNIHILYNITLFHITNYIRNILFLQ